VVKARVFFFGTSREILKALHYQGEHFRGFLVVFWLLNSLQKEVFQ